MPKFLTILTGICAALVVGAFLVLVVRPWAETTFRMEYKSVDVTGLRWSSLQEVTALKDAGWEVIDLWYDSCGNASVQLRRNPCKP